MASTGAALSTVGWHGEGAYWPILLFWGVFIAYGRTPAGIFVGVTGYYLAPSWAAVLAINTALDHSIFASLLLWLAHGAINAAAWTILPVIFYLARILKEKGRAHVVAAICYESLLLTHWLRAWMATRGSVASHVVVVSSIWFVDGAAGEKTDRLMRLHALRASKMLGLPFINAVNRAPPNNKTNGRF